MSDKKIFSPKDIGRKPIADIKEDIREQVKKDTKTQPKTTPRTTTKTTTPKTTTKTDPLADKPDHIPAPPQSPSIYDKGQPLEGKGPDKIDTGLTPQQEQIIKDAPKSPISPPTKKEPTPKKPVKEDTGTVVVVTPEQHGDVLAAQKKYEKAAKELQDWTHDPEAEYYIVPKKEFQPQYLFGPGATVEQAAHLPRDDKHIHLSPKQMEIYMRNVSRDYERVAASIYYDPDIIKYTKEQAVFKVGDKEYTWKELKQKEPALALKRTPEGVIVDYDYTTWFEKQDPLTKSVGRFAGGLADWDYIVETVGRGQYDKGTDIVAKWTYEQKKRLADKDYFGVVLRTPVVSTVAVPFAGGAVIGAAVKAAGTVPTMLAQKGLTHTAKGLRVAGKVAGVGIMGTVVGGAAFDVAETYRTDPDKAAAKMLTYGTQFTALRAGAKAGAKAVDSVKTQITKLKAKTPVYTHKKTWDYQRETLKKYDYWKQRMKQITKRPKRTPQTQDVIQLDAHGDVVIAKKLKVPKYTKPATEIHRPPYTAKEFRLGTKRPKFGRLEMPAKKPIRPKYDPIRDPDVTVKTDQVSKDLWKKMVDKQYKDSVMFDDPYIKPTVQKVSGKQWKQMVDKKYKDVFKLDDPDYTVKVDRVSTKLWDKYKMDFETKTVKQQAVLLQKSLKPVITSKLIKYPKTYIPKEWKGVYDVPQKVTLARVPLKTKITGLLTSWLKPQHIRSALSVAPLATWKVAPLLATPELRAYRFEPVLAKIPDRMRALSYQQATALDRVSMQMQQQIPQEDVLSTQISSQVQQQAQASDQVQKQVQKAVLKKPVKHTSTRAYRPVSYHQLTQTKAPWAGLPEFYTDLRKESKRIMDFDYMKGYRERKHKTITMKDLLGW